ncbi:MAG: hypothetical protein ACP5S8_06040 [Hydrogenobaculum sp.]|nr:MAG: hypothetical protein C0170_01190 [Hydrogenobaculum sp.]
MELVDIFYKRATMFWKSFLGLITISYIALLLSYFIIKLPIKLPFEIRFYLIGGELFLGMIVALLSYFVKKQYLPASVHEPYWSYKAIKGYFWPYAIASAPFLFAGIFYLLVADLISLSVGFFISFFLIFYQKPKKDDIIY